MHKPHLPTRRDYLNAAAGFFLATCLVIGLWLVADALNYQPSDDYRSIMHAARMLAQGR
ncbi:MAG: hypothetical protein AB7D27_14800 [Desulfomicrobium sp.]